jgi:Regulator of Ty1 transposition protein 107 BRCT domain
MGGEIVSDILKATHLVADKVRRTVKFLAALNSGIHIVSPKWIAASSRERQWAGAYNSARTHMRTHHLLLRLSAVCSTSLFFFALRSSLIFFLRSSLCVCVCVCVCVFSSFSSSS